MRNRLVMTVAALVLAASTALAVAVAPASATPSSAAAGAEGRHLVAGIVRLSGAQEVPPADPDGRGTFAYVAVGRHLCYFLSARNIEPAAAAHIHAAPRGVNGGIVVGLALPGDRPAVACIRAAADGTPDSPMVLVQSELDAIIANPAGFYANVHNATFPAGAIRGQLR